MLKRIFPASFDNCFPGQKAALWLFVPILLITLIMSTNSVFIGHVVALKADGIPLDDFTPAGADAVVALFGLWGIGQLALRLLGVLALLRYRAMVPLLYAVLLVDAVARRVFLLFHPIVRVSATTGGFPTNQVLIVSMVVGLVLCVIPRKRPAEPLNTSSFYPPRPEPSPRSAA